MAAPLNPRHVSAHHGHNSELSGSAFALRREGPRSGRDPSGAGHTPVPSACLRGSRSHQQGPRPLLPTDARICVSRVRVAHTRSRMFSLRKCLFGSSPCVLMGLFSLAVFQGPSVSWILTHCQEDGEQILSPGLCGVLLWP